MHAHLTTRTPAPRRPPAAPQGGRASDRDQVFSIGDLAREYGVSLRTLRFYEDRGLLSPRREGTSRFYDGADRARLALILKGKKLGLQSPDGGPKK